MPEFTVALMVLNIGLQPQLWSQRQGISTHRNRIRTAIVATSAAFSRNVKVFLLTATAI